MATAGAVVVPTAPATEVAVAVSQKNRKVLTLSFTDDAATDECIRPAAHVVFGLFLRDAVMVHENGGTVGDGEILPAEGSPQQQGSGVKGNDLGHVGLGLALLDDEVLAGYLADLVVVFDAHDVFVFLVLEWRKYRQIPLITKRI